MSPDLISKSLSAAVIALLFASPTFAQANASSPSSAPNSSNAHKDENHETRAKINSLLEAQKFQDAEKELEKACRPESKLIDMFPVMVAATEKSKRPDLAIRACRAWIRYCPDGAAHEALAAVYHNAGHDAEALREYQSAITREPANMRYREERGSLLEKLARYDQAFQDFDYVVKHSSGDAQTKACGNRGLVYFRMKNWKAAVEDLDRFLSLKNDSFFADLRNQAVNQLKK